MKLAALIGAFTASSITTMSPMLVTSRTRGVSPSQPTGSPPELLSEPVGPVASVAPVASVGVDPVVDAEPLVPASPELRAVDELRVIALPPLEEHAVRGVTRRVALLGLLGRAAGRERGDREQSEARPRQDPTNTSGHHHAPRVARPRLRR